MQHSSEADLPGLDAQRAVLEMVRTDGDVLQLGCAGGLTQAWSQLGCKVVAVERDPALAEAARPYADQVLVGELATFDLSTELGEGRFDIVAFHGTLEHVPDPADLLRRSRRLLRPGGCAVLTVHNVAHGDMRLALLAGRFDAGMADADRLHFFTWSSLRALLRAGGFVATEVRRVSLPLFGTEIPLDPSEYHAAVVEGIRSDPESETHTFVVRAVPADEHEDLRALADRAEAAEAGLRAAQVERDELTHQLDEVIDEVGRLRVSEAEARLRLEIMSDKARDLEASSDALAMLRATRIVRWSRPARHALRRLRGRSSRAGGEADGRP